MVYFYLLIDSQKYKMVLICQGIYKKNTL